jgi:peroxiredoxin Q/BCP
LNPLKQSKKKEAHFKMSFRIITLCILFTINANSQEINKLKIGDKAPVINSIDQNGEKITLEQFKGKKIVLYFYPKDMTPGCTMQSCNLRDNYQTLLNEGYVVLGCSADSPEKHQKFIVKYDLPFPLISDESKQVLNAYGVWGPKKFMGRAYDGISRTTFVIDENGVIIDIITKVKTKEHTKQILK